MSIRFLNERLLKLIQEYEEETTSKIQRLKDYIRSQGNEIIYEWENHKIYFVLDSNNQDNSVILQTSDSTLKFSQLSEDMPVEIQLISKRKLSTQVKYTEASTPKEILHDALPLIKRHASGLKLLDIEDDQPEPIDVHQLTQCVIKIRDIGNDWEFIEVAQDNTQFSSQYDVNLEFTDEDPTVQYILAYRTNEGDEFYDENGYIIDMEV